MSPTAPDRGRIDWNSDLVKHYVRLYGWLPPCQHRALRVRSALSAKKRLVPLKYFTFCASEAIDVFMLAEADVLEASDSSRGFETVYWCEGNAEEYGRIAQLVSQNGFLGKLEDIVLVTEPDDELTVDDVASGPRRLELTHREQHERLVAAFPFDIINLDVNGVFFPPQTEVVSPMLEVVRRVLDWQRQPDTTDGHECTEFTLLLTTHVSAADLNTQAIQQLVERVKRNIQDCEDFATAYQDRFGAATPDQLVKRSFAAFFAAALPKVLVRDAVQRGWAADYRGISLYQRTSHTGKTYHMMSSVTQFARLEDAAEHGLLELHFETAQEAYQRTTVAVLQHPFHDCDRELSEEGADAEVQRHLGQVKAYRDRFTAP